jgi:hypothetical protein
VIRPSGGQNLDETRVIRVPDEMPRTARNTTPRDLPQEAPPKKSKKRKKRSCLGCGCMGLITIVGVMALCVALGLLLAALAIYMTCRMDGNYDASVVAEMVNRGLL